MADEKSEVTGEVDVQATLAQLMGQSDALNAKFAEIKGIFNEAQAALNAAKLELTEFNNKYGRVLKLLE